MAKSCARPLTTPRNCTPETRSQPEKEKRPCRRLWVSDFISCPETPPAPEPPQKRDPGGDVSGADTQRTAMMRTHGDRHRAPDAEEHPRRGPCGSTARYPRPLRRRRRRTVPGVDAFHARHWRRLLVLVLRDPDRARVKNIGVAHRSPAIRENAQGLPPAGPRRRRSRLACPRLAARMTRRAVAPVARASPADLIGIDA